MGNAKRRRGDAETRHKVLRERGQSPMVVLIAISAKNAIQLIAGDCPRSFLQDHLPPAMPYADWFPKVMAPAYDLSPVTVYSKDGKIN
jgi:hypothetical protein